MMSVWCLDAFDITAAATAFPELVIFANAGIEITE